MMLVFANSSQEAESWARSYNIKRHVWRFVYTSDDVRGYYHCATVFLPNYQPNPAQAEAMALMRAMAGMA
jgi:hypothetical protein